MTLPAYSLLRYYRNAMLCAWSLTFWTITGLVESSAEQVWLYYMGILLQCRQLDYAYSALPFVLSVCKLPPRLGHQNRSVSFDLFQMYELLSHRFVTTFWQSRKFQPPNNIILNIECLHAKVLVCGGWCKVARENTFGLMQFVWVQIFRGKCNPHNVAHFWPILVAVLIESFVHRSGFQ